MEENERNGTTMRENNVWKSKMFEGSHRKKREPRKNVDLKDFMPVDGKGKSPIKILTPDLNYSKKQGTKVKIKSESEVKKPKEVKKLDEAADLFGLRRKGAKSSKPKISPLKKQILSERQQRVLLTAPVFKPFPCIFHSCLETADANDAAVAEENVEKIHPAYFGMDDQEFMAQTKALETLQIQCKENDSHVTQAKLQNLHHVRDYVHQALSKTLDELVLNLLAKSYTFQSNAAQKSPEKFKQKKRLVFGLHETMKKLKVNKVHLLILCVNLEESAALDEKILQLVKLSRAMESDPKFCFAFSSKRRKIAKAVGFRNNISCVGVLSLDGVYEDFKKISAEVERLKKVYSEVIKIKIQALATTQYCADCKKELGLLVNYCVICKKSHCDRCLDSLISKSKHVLSRLSTNDVRDKDFLQSFGCCAKNTVSVLHPMPETCATGEICF